MELFKPTILLRPKLPNFLGHSVVMLSCLQWSPAIVDTDRLQKQHGVAILVVINSSDFLHAFRATYFLGFEDT